MATSRTGATTVLRRVSGLLTALACMLVLRGAALPAQAAEILLHPDRSHLALAAGDSGVIDPGTFGGRALGNADAPVTVIGYATSTSCPACAHFWAATFPELKKRYVDTGKVRFVLREYAVDELSTAFLLAAHCSAPDRYFQTIQTLFARQWEVLKPRKALATVAQQAGVTEDALAACLASPQALALWQQAGNLAAELGQTPMPAFLINGKVLSGDVSITEMEQQFAPYLKN